MVAYIFLIFILVLKLYKFFTIFFGIKEDVIRYVLKQAHIVKTEMREKIRKPNPSPNLKNCHVTSIISTISKKCIGTKTF